MTEKAVEADEIRPKKSGLFLNAKFFRADFRLPLQKHHQLGWSGYCLTEKAVEADEIRPQKIGFVFECEDFFGQTFVCPYKSTINSDGQATA
ncbi:MAG: hypothetical protein NZ805_02165 [Armatimonadetes bacterium]|nr:hypothetical protein [Armatimonadota bacterium]